MSVAQRHQSDRRPPSLALRMLTALAGNLAFFGQGLGGTPARKTRVKEATRGGAFGKYYDRYSNALTETNWQLNFKHPFSETKRRRKSHG